VSHTLHLGDALGPAGLASLPDLSIDVTIVDCPYSEHVHTRSRRGATGCANDGESGNGRTSFNRVRDLGFASITPKEIAALAKEYARLTRRWVLSFCDVESVHLWRDAFTAAGLEPIRVGAWIKVGATPSFVGDRPAVGYEAIVIAHRRGRKRWNGGGRHALWTFPIVLERGNGEHRVHTTQKPEALLAALVFDFSDPGETILDSHAGSGTCGVVAKRMGRSFVGWEIQPKYHAIASARIAGATEQPELCFAKPRKVKQSSLPLPPEPK